jgi:DNA replicative helicase MCM subunit Mcm2 (Cdc46/Mcm family)
MVLKEDALDVIELMTQSVDEVHMDERGIRDRTRGGAGGTSNRKFKKLFEEEIRKFTGPYMTMDDLRRMGDRFDDVSEKQLKDTVDSFRNDGILLRNADGTYRLQ